MKKIKDYTFNWLLKVLASAIHEISLRMNDGIAESDQKNWHSYTCIAFRLVPNKPTESENITYYFRAMQEADFAVRVDHGKKPTIVKHRWFPYAVDPKADHLKPV